MNTTFHARRPISDSFEGFDAERNIKYWLYSIIEELSEPFIEVKHAGPQRQATLNTSTIAGLKILRIPNESIAVAMTYGLDKRNSQCGGETYAMVYHLGGKIFEVFPLEIDHGAINILYTAVDILVGKTSIGVFEDINMDLFNRTPSLVEQVLKNSGKYKEINDMHTSRRPLHSCSEVQSLLNEIFNGKEPSKDIHTEATIPWGAALKGAIFAEAKALYPRTTIPDRLDKQTSKPDPPLGWSLRDAGRLARITTSTRNSTSKRYLPAPHDIPRTEVTCEMNPESVLTAEAIEKAPEKIAPLIKEAEGFAAEEEAKKKAEAMNSQESCPESQMDTGGVIKKVLGHQKRNILATSKMFSNAIDESGPKAVPDAPEDKLANMQALSKSIPVEDDENGLFADESIKHDEL
ncbi:ATPase with role in protein import into the ER [Tulasnella sp. 330]|nr:ATPase with role in protein import into the ER [Tulasnella sp. 330]